MRSIHIHAHFTPQCFWRATEDGGGWHTLRREKNARGQECAMVGGRRQPLPPRAKWTHEERLADMDSLGVDVQVGRWNCVALCHSANRIMCRWLTAVSPQHIMGDAWHRVRWGRRAQREGGLRWLEAIRSRY